MVSTIGVPIVDYTLAVKNQDNLLAQFQKWPSYAQSVTYFRANIGNVTSVDDLLNNRKLLTVALSAFQLESQVDAKGILRQLLTQDPTATGSLAQQLLDPRYKQFAQAFAGLRSDGGASVQNPNSINTVLAGYQANEYSKWVSNNDNDPTVRQALFFQQTVQDTIDISATGKLFTQFQQAPDTQQSVSAYTAGISQVTSVNDLLANPKVLNVALAAFNIDPQTVTPDTLRRLLTEPTTSPTTNPTAPSLATDPTAVADLRLAQFAITFSSLATDGGVTVQASAAVNDVVARYQRNQFAKTVAAGDPTANAITFGSSGSNSIKTLLADFQTKTGIGQSVSYYQSNIGGVTSVDGLLGDPQLLNVALGAFNIDPTKVSTDVVRQLLTNDPNASADIQAQATTLLQSDPDIAAFAKTYGALSPNGGGGFTQIGSLFKQFQQQGGVQSAVAHYQNTIGTVNSVAGLTGDAQLLSVALTAFGLDPNVSASTVNNLLTESPASQAADPLVTTDARWGQFIQAFGSLNTDGGAAIGGQNSTNAVVSAYQSNAFAQTLATNDPATIAADFADGSMTSDKLFANFAASSGVSQPIAYYQSHIGNVTSAADLAADPKLLNVALGAFNLASANLTTGAITDLLSAAPSAAATALTQQSPDVAAFVAAFSSLNSDNGTNTRSDASIMAVSAAYLTAQFKQSIEAKTQAIVANPSLAVAAPPGTGVSGSAAAVATAFLANQFKQSIVSTVQNVTATPAAGTISTLQILSNATLAAVTRGALGLPDAVGALPVDQQQFAMTRAGFDPAKLTDPSFLNQFINQFLGNAGLALSSNDPLMALFQSGNTSDIPDPTVPPAPFDFSFLSGNSGGGSILNLFA